MTNLGCSKCYCTFFTGIFGKTYTGFDRDSWVACTNEKHWRDISEIRKALTKTERQWKESEYGCRYSCLLQLPYFDPVRMHILDLMHNLYIGTAKTITRVWIKQGILRQSDLKRINSRTACIVIRTMNSLVHCFQQWSTHLPLLQSKWWFGWITILCIVSMSCCLKATINVGDTVLASQLLSKRCITASKVSIADRFSFKIC